MSSHYLVVAALFRNEAPFLAEWVRFHRIVGVDHIYLYDNGSTDHPEAVLAPLVDEGCVTVRPWPVPFHERAQATAYTDCLNRVRGQTRWLACIDIDEFLFSPQSLRLESVLHEFEGYPGVVVHWQVYGSSGEEHASDRPVIARFARRAPTHWIRNRRVKSLADPAAALEASMHYFTYRNQAHAVTERHEPVRVRRRPLFKKPLQPLYNLLGPAARHLDPYAGRVISTRSISCEVLRINHYAVKSREEFSRKAQLKKAKRRYDRFDYFAYHDRNEVFDPILWRYLPALAELGVGDRIEAQAHSSACAAHTPRDRRNLR
jgi:Glycosyltransferase family 92